jgi:hypothetical protein
MAFKNEEDIRGKLLLPFLEDLGFNLSEISLEESFSIRLGRNEHIIKGRSDILCKRNGDNLFIIELKKDSIPITEKDIKQGISYARALVGNIAPFTIVSNGKVTKIIDTISEKELNGVNLSEQSPFWKNGCTLSIDDDLRIRYEALKKFISFSDENLKVFCESQVNDRMGTITGGLKDSNSKFVKELHVERQILQIRFKNFLESEYSVFGLVGTAGVGKTSSICSLVLNNLKESFVLFYNAALIDKTPLDFIARDLNLFFSNKNEGDLVLKKLDELGSYLSKKIIIFIDAIDESTNLNLVHELSELAYSASKLNNVKICISCKSNIWSNFLKVKDTFTHLYQELIKHHNHIKEAENLPGFLLTNFDKEEVNNIIPIYRKAFEFKGEISEQLLHELKNGFFLRIFSVVYSQLQVPEIIDNKELIKIYLKKSLEKTDIGFIASMRILSRIGVELVKHKFTSIEMFEKSGLEVENLLERLDFSLDENIPEDLFNRNILIKSNKEESYNISFYYSKIRDYIICYHSYRLDKLTDNELYNILEDFYLNYIGNSAIGFYIKHATYQHKSTIVKFKKEKAEKYVINYEQYLDSNFRNFKEEFSPYTKGSIGIILPKKTLEEDGYALFPLDPEDSNKVHFEGLGSPFTEPYDKNKLMQKGVNTVYGSNTSLLNNNQLQTLKGTIFKELKEIIEKGKIKTYTSDILLLEKLSTVLYFYYKKLDYTFEKNDYYLPRLNLVYPINLTTLQQKLLKFRAYEHFKRMNIERNQIDKMVQNVIENNIQIPSLRIRGDFPPFEELFKISTTLLSKGYSIIESHHLPCPNIPVDVVKKQQEARKKYEIKEIINSHFSEAQAKLYIKQFFNILEKCYKEFVEHYFPTIKDRFSFYNDCPHEYYFYMKDSDVLKWGGFGYKKSSINKIQINYLTRELNENVFERDNIKMIRHFSLDIILKVNDYHRYPVKTFPGLNTDKVDEYSVIRNWIYKLLEDDMEDIFKENENDGF